MKNPKFIDTAFSGTPRKRAKKRRKLRLEWKLIERECKRTRELQLNRSREMAADLFLAKVEDSYHWRASENFHVGGDVVR